MIILTIIIGILALILLITGIYRQSVHYYGGWEISIGVMLFSLLIVLLLFITNVKLSDQTLTGYVYSKDSFAGVTRYHIRYSENAGEDSQPSFCTNTDSESDKSNAKLLDSLVGSGEKVTVNIPSVGWYFSNDLWHCSSNAKLLK